MKLRIPPILFLSVLLLSLALFPALSWANAQSGKAIRVSIPDPSEYPLMTVYLDPFDRDGTPIEDLQIEQITLVEDGIARELIGFQPLNPGIQIVTALNLSPPFAIQDINGRSRFDFIRESLLTWASQPQQTGMGADNLSIIDNLNLEKTHVERKTDWIEALEELNPSLRDIEANFNVLARAIEIASDPVNQAGMKKVVLFFSPAPSSEGFTAIDSLISLAKDNQVQVYTILVSSPDFFQTAGAQKLQELSAETGGVFLTFSGEEPVADLGQLLFPLRTTYKVQYHSSIVSPGLHTLEATIASTPGSFEGVREFTLDIQPPNPIFITPPRSITRTIIDEKLAEGEPVRFEPSSLTLPVLIEFPDSHPRDLEELIFRVDGEIISTKTSPPFDQFIWDVDVYQVSGTHYLSLEAVDIMGLSRISLETPIEVEVVLPTRDVWDITRENGPALFGLGLILILGLTLFWLISRGRIQPGTNRFLPRIKNLFLQANRNIKALLLSRKEAPISVPVREFDPYRLIPVSDLSQQLFPEPLQIDQPQITIGNSAREDIVRVQHPSIIPEHARIISAGQKQYQVTDLGSTAGTWINYQQIPPSSPHFLKDGDIINFGEAAFRFQIKNRPNSLADNEEN